MIAHEEIGASITQGKDGFPSICILGLALSPICSLIGPQRSDSGGLESILMARPTRIPSRGVGKRDELLSVSSGSHQGKVE